MDMSQPPQPTYQPGGQQYQTDKVLGIIIMVLSACGAIGGIMGLAGGGLLAAAGAGAAGQAGNAQGAAVAAAGGGILMLLSVFLIIQSVLGFAIGYGIMKSLRWGFLIGTIVYGIGLLIQIVGVTKSGAQGLIGLVIGALLFGYCFMRLTGRTGPPLN